MSIGTRISELRREKNISQGQLASIMDVTRQAVSKWENDTSTPDALKLIKLADVLNVDIEYLATGARKDNSVLPTKPVEDDCIIQKNPHSPSPLPLILFCLFFFLFGIFFTLFFVLDDE